MLYNTDTYEWSLEDQLIEEAEKRFNLDHYATKGYQEYKQRLEECMAWVRKIRGPR